MSMCPCRVLEPQTKLTYADCCGPIISGKKKGLTAESVMRARYSAYAVKEIDYVEKTQVATNDEEFNKEEALKWAASSDWLGLEVKHTSKGGADDQSGVVEFIAHYKDKASGKELDHHETSHFVRKNGEWLFKEGQIHSNLTVKRDAPKVGRNDPCSCGSGKKFKKCCGA